MLFRIKKFIQFTVILLTVSLFSLFTACVAPEESSVSSSEGSGSNSQTEDGRSSGTTNGNNDEGSSSGSNPILAPLSAVACDSGDDLLNHAPLDLDEINVISPLGHVDGLSGHLVPTSHTYMSIVDRTKLNPIYAPADIVISKISKRINADNSITQAISFFVCQDVSGHFGHVTLIADSIQSQIDDVIECSESGGLTHCSADNLDIKVNAGEIIGYAGGEFRDSSSNVDFGMTDYRKEMVFTYRTNIPTNLYAVCPYDYFADGDIKEALYDRLEFGSGVDPLCGAVSYDEVDSIQGVWVVTGADTDTNQSIDDQDLIALVPHNVASDSNIFSLGIQAWGENGQFIYRTEDTGLVNRAFTDVDADGNQYCFDGFRSHWAVLGSDVDGYILLEKTSEEHLKIERVVTGSCPADPNGLSFTANALEYDR